ncbi:MAG: HAD-IIIA family hydrolase [Candidatus Cloacimonetes bacterium]|nr:HAD-IIIA family hydrolase [Candidatus Cloacimonadota bacterium]
MDFKKAVFLDRDGTINFDENGYINNPDDFQLFSFSGEAIVTLNEMGYLVFVVTNQSGVARNLYKVEDIELVHKKMTKNLGEKGAIIDDIFFSPYHKKGAVEPYNIDHEDRKPGLGMFKKALKKYNFNIKKSFMIGDRYADIVFGKKAGLTAILVLTGNGERAFYKKRKEWEYKPDFVVRNLLSAVKLISKLESK